MSWHRAAETAAIVGSVALCVLIAGPGSALEGMFVPLFGSVGGPTQRLTDLAFGIPLGVLLLSGLGLWAWGARLRPSGAALTALATLAVSFDLAFEGRVTAFGWVLVTALWLLVIYQLLTFRAIDTVVRRPPALVLAVVACIVPWLIQTGRMLAAGALEDDHIFVVVLAVVLSLLLVLPLLRLETFAAAGIVAAVGAVIYALMSLLWGTSAVALPRIIAVPAVAAAIAYVDTVRHLAARTRRARGIKPDTRDAG